MQVCKRYMEYCFLFLTINIQAKLGLNFNLTLFEWNYIIMERVVMLMMGIHVRESLFNTVVIVVEKHSYVVNNHM